MLCQVYNLIIFSKCIELCSYHHSPVLHFHHTRKFPLAHLQPIPCPLLSPRQPLIYLVFFIIAILIVVWWYLNLALICIFSVLLMATIFLSTYLLLLIFFGNVSIQICPFFSWIFCLIELQDFFFSVFCLYIQYQISDSKYLYSMACLHFLTGTF